MERIVVVGVVPVDRARRHKTLLVSARRKLSSLDDRFLDLRIIYIQFSILVDNIAAAISGQEIIENIVWIIAIRRHLEAKPINPAHSLVAQYLLHILKEVVISIPGLWNIFHGIAGFFDQRLPDMVR